jgi:hypothetical protein
MITKFYWLSRILGYLICMIGVFLYLANQTADPNLSQKGFVFIGIGFLFFFFSYALRIWIRFGPGRKTDEK